MENKINKEFLEEWIENDINPFIIFDKVGKVVHLNREAQYLLADVSPKEIFSLCQTYANYTYGFRTTDLDLKYGHMKFYAITIGYLDDDLIGIKLYNAPSKKINILSQKAETANIYLLLDLCINASLTNSKAKIQNEWDPTFPELKLCIKDFTTVLNNIYKLYFESSTILTRLFLQTGEYIKYEGNKFPIFIIEIQGDKFQEEGIYEIERKSEDMNLTVFHSKNKTIIKSPFIAA